MADDPNNDGPPELEEAEALLRDINQRLENLRDKVQRPTRDDSSDDQNTLAPCQNKHQTRNLLKSGR